MLSSKLKETCSAPMKNYYSSHLEYDIKHHCSAFNLRRKFLIFQNSTKLSTNNDIESYNSLLKRYLNISTEIESRKVKYREDNLMFKLLEHQAHFLNEFNKGYITKNSKFLIIDADNFKKVNVNRLFSDFDNFKELSLFLKRYCPVEVSTPNEYNNGKSLIYNLNTKLIYI